MSDYRFVDGSRTISDKRLHIVDRLPGVEPLPTDQAAQFSPALLQGQRMALHWLGSSHRPAPNRIAQERLARLGVKCRALSFADSSLAPGLQSELINAIEGSDIPPEDAVFKLSLRFGEPEKVWLKGGAAMVAGFCDVFRRLCLEEIDE